MTPVMANILMINLFFHIAPGRRVCGVHLWVHAGAAVAGTRRLLGLFWGQQASEPARSRGFHRYIAALIVLIVIAQAAFVFLYVRR